MAVETLISVEEYLNTSYEPDMEYVDGVLEARTVGDAVHSRVQMNASFQLCRKYPDVFVWPELRSSVTPTRFRLPDICVTLTNADSKVLWEAAFLIIEILSEDDRMTRVTRRLQDFAEKGVPHIWLFDPSVKMIYRYESGTLHKIEKDVIATDNPRIELTRGEIFDRLPPQK